MNSPEGPLYHKGELLFGIHEARGPLRREGVALHCEGNFDVLAIHQAGLILQVDAPDLAIERTMTFQDLGDADFVKVCELHMHAINTATEGIPKDRWRLHCCWGNWEGPHVHDVALEKMGSGKMAYTPNTQLFNQTGQPAMSVPLHWNTAGLPIGVQLAARFGDEATLFRVAAQLEAARPWAGKKPPMVTAAM